MPVLILSGGAIGTSIAYHPAARDAEAVVVECRAEDWCAACP